MILVEDFSGVLARLLPDPAPRKIAIAVSGGVDSLCLCLLVQAWANSCGVQVVALTVDHLLRAASSDEARQVHSWLKGRGVEHHILVWEKASYPKNIQNSARQARYDLLQEWCLANEVQYVLVGHNAQDQFETILQRLAHHSGVMGLSGIEDVVRHDQITLVRPLLRYSRQEITETMIHFQQEWIDDPSNVNPQFTRVKIRQNVDELTNYGLNFSRVLAFSKKMQKTKTKTLAVAQSFLKENVQFHEYAYLDFNFPDFMSLDMDVRLYVLGVMLQQISGKYYMPDTQSLRRAVDRMAGMLTICCHGCVLVHKNQKVCIFREYKNISHIVYMGPKNRFVWDGRFEFRLRKPFEPNKLRVEAIGEAWKEWSGDKIKELPYAVRPTLPGIWQKERLLHIPVLDYYEGLEVKVITNMLNFKP